MGRKNEWIRLGNGGDIIDTTEEPTAVEVNPSKGGGSNPGKGEESRKKRHEATRKGTYTVHQASLQLEGGVAGEKKKRL